MNHVNSKIALLKFDNTRIADSFNLAYKIDRQKHKKKSELIDIVLVV
jgi:hypothetical protein